MAVVISKDQEHDVYLPCTMVDFSCDFFLAISFSLIHYVIIY